MNEMLPAYAAGSLRGAERDLVRAHLAGCARCRADLAAWQAIAQAAPPNSEPPNSGPPDAARMVRAVLTRSALEGGVDPPRGTGWARRPRYAGALVVAEARLIRLAVPVASVLVMALGVALVLIQAAAVAQPVTGPGPGPGPGAGAGTGTRADLMLALVAPIVAAAGVAGTYRSRRDPVAELVAATPAAAPLLLLVRLTLVFGYDLVLAVVASVVTATADDGAASLRTLIAAWLGPMALLSSVSLLVAVWFGPDVGLGAAIGLWAVRVLAGGVFARDGWPARLIVDVWSTNAAVLSVSAVLGIVAVVLAGRLAPFGGEPHGGWRATHPT